MPRNYSGREEHTSRPYILGESGPSILNRLQAYALRFSRLHLPGSNPPFVRVMKRQPKSEIALSQFRKIPHQHQSSLAVVLAFQDSDPTARLRWLDLQDS